MRKMQLKLASKRLFTFTLTASPPWEKYENVYYHVLALYRVNRLTQVELESNPIVPIILFSPEIFKFPEHFPQIIFRHSTYLSLILF